MLLRTLHQRRVRSENNVAVSGISSEHLVIHNVNRQLRNRYHNAEDPMIVFRYRGVGHRVMMQIPNEGPRVRFSQDLARKLGFESNKFYSSPEKAARTVVALTQNIHSAYVDCDLLEHVTVGDTKAPLLRIVDFPNDNRQGNVYHNLNPVLFHISLLQKVFR